MNYFEIEIPILQMADSSLFRLSLNNKTEIARTLLWPKAMIVLGILVMVLMVNFYATPYVGAITKQTPMEFRP